MEPSHEGAPGASATADGESASPTRLRVDTHAQDPAPNGTHGYPRHAGSPVDGLHPAVATLRRYSGSGPAGTPESAAAVTPSAFQSPAPVSSSTLDTVQHVLDLVLHPPADNPLAWVQVADAAQLPDHLMLLLYRTANSVAQSKQTLQDLPSDTQHIVELRQQKRTIDAATAAHIRAVQRLRRPLSAVQHGMPRGDLRAGLATPPSSVVGGSPWQPLPSPPVKAGRTPGGAPPAQGTEGAELVVVLDVGNFDDDDDVDSEVEVDPLVRLRDEEERLENRIKRLRAASKPRDSCDEAYAYKIVKWKWFERFILAVILINTLFLALDSPTLDEDSDLSFAIRKADLVFTILFTLEMLLKWVGLGLCKYRHSYFRDAWNWLDFIIVVEGIVSTFTAGSGVNFQGLRTFRVLRPLRTITHLEGLRVVVNALLLSLPLLVNTLLVCVFYFLIFGIVCVQLFAGQFRMRCFWEATGGLVESDSRLCGGEHSCGADQFCARWSENPNFGITSFDNIVWACNTIFMCISLEGWAQVMYDAQDATSQWAWILFVLLILFGAFILINLMLAVIMTKFREAEEAQHAVARAKRKQEIRHARRMAKSPHNLVHRRTTRLKLKMAHQRKKAVAQERILRSVSQSSGGFRGDASRPSSAGGGRSVGNSDGSPRSSMSGMDGANPLSVRFSDADVTRPGDGRGGRRRGLTAQPSGKSLVSLPEEGASTSADASTAPDVDALEVNLKAGKWEMAEEIRHVRRMKSFGELPTPLTRKQRVARWCQLHSIGVRLGFGRLRDWCASVTGTATFKWGIGACIVLNTVSLAVDHYGIDATTSDVLADINLFFTILFTVEMVMMLMSLGFYGYCSDRFNLFDGFIVIMSYVDLLVGAGSGLTAFRSARIFRIVRLVRYLESMRMILRVVARSLSSFGYIAALLMLFCFIYSILGMQLFGGQMGSGDDLPRNNFDTLHWSFISVFQILSGEAWNEIMYIGVAAGGWGTVVFFISWVIIGQYILLNLFLAVLLDNFSNWEEEEAAAREAMLADLRRKKDVAKAKAELAMEQKRLAEEERQKAAKEAREKCEADGTGVMSESEHQAAARRAALASRVLQLWTKGSNKAGKKAKEKKRKEEESATSVTWNLDDPSADDKGDADANAYVEPEGPLTWRDSFLFVLSPRSGFSRLCRRLVLQPLATVRLLPLSSWGTALYRTCRRKPIIQSDDVPVSVTITFEKIIMAFILMSSATLAVETPDSDGDSTLYALEVMFTIIFTIEVVVKVAAFGFVQHANAYLRSAYNVVDFFVVVSSLLNLLITGVDLGALRTLRLLRCLRPLRLVSFIPGMKTVVNALFMSLSGLINVFFVLVVVWFMFAILGVQLFAGKMHECTDPSFPPNTHKDGVSVIDPSTGAETFSVLPCEGRTFLVPATDTTAAYMEQAEWQPADANFDNVFNAMLTLFITSSGEGWPGVMFKTADVTEVDHSRQRDHSPWMPYYFVLYICLGQFFLLNLFVGVVFDKFMRLKRRMGSFGFLTEQQRDWVEAQRRLNVTAPFRKPPMPPQWWRQKVYKFAVNDDFDSFVLLLIVLNVGVLAASFDAEPGEWSRAQEVLNYTFTVSFAVEAVLKIIGMGWREYWSDRWNKFDFIVVAGSLFDLAVSLFNTSVLRAVRVTRAFSRLFRLVRVTRVLRLAKSIDGLRKLIMTLWAALPALLNVGSLLLLLFFIYAVLGVFLFGEVQLQEDLNVHANFSHFGIALLTLFRIATGEGWEAIMFDCMNEDMGGSKFAPLYFSSFVVIATFILINLFVMIIVEDFDEVDRQSRGLTNHVIDAFKLSWAQYDPFGRKEIEWRYLEPMLRQVPPPLGIQGKASFKEYSQHVQEMGLMSFDGKLHYKDVLLACHRVAYGFDVPDHVMQRIGTHPKALHRTLSRAVLKRKKRAGELDDDVSVTDDDAKSRRIGITRLDEILASTFIQRAFRKRRDEARQAVLLRQQNARSMARITGSASAHSLPTATIGRTHSGGRLYGTPRTRPSLKKFAQSERNLASRAQRAVASPPTRRPLGAGVERRRSLQFITAPNAARDEYTMRAGASATSPALTGSNHNLSTAGSSVSGERSRSGSGGSRGSRASRRRGVPDTIAEQGDATTAPQDTIVVGLVPYEPAGDSASDSGLPAAARHAVPDAPSPAPAVTAPTPASAAVGSAGAVDADGGGAGERAAVVAATGAPSTVVGASVIAAANTSPLVDDAAQQILPAGSDGSDSSDSGSSSSDSDGGASTMTDGSSVASSAVGDSDTSASGSDSDSDSDSSSSSSGSSASGSSGSGASSVTSGVSSVPSGAVPSPLDALNTYRASVASRGGRGRSRGRGGARRNTRRQRGAPVATHRQPGDVYTDFVGSVASSVDGGDGDSGTFQHSNPMLGASFTPRPASASGASSMTDDDAESTRPPAEGDAGAGAPPRHAKSAGKGAGKSAVPAAAVPTTAAAPVDATAAAPPPAMSPSRRAQNGAPPSLPAGASPTTALSPASAAFPGSPRAAASPVAGTAAARSGGSPRASPGPVAGSAGNNGRGGNTGQPRRVQPADAAAGGHSAPRDVSSSPAPVNASTPASPASPATARRRSLKGVGLSLRIISKFSRHMGTPTSTRSLRSTQSMHSTPRRQGRSPRRSPAKAIGGSSTPRAPSPGHGSGASEGGSSAGAAAAASTATARRDHGEAAGMDDNGDGAEPGSAPLDLGVVVDMVPVRSRRRGAKKKKKRSRRSSRGRSRGDEEHAPVDAE